MTDDLVSLVGNERDAFASGYGLAQVVDEVRDNLTVISERRQMHRADAGAVSSAFGTNLQGGRVY